jgi:hypothetical protein
MNDDELPLSVPKMRKADDQIAELRQHLELAKRMREAQRQYFRTKSHSILVKCKQLEREFDEAVQ